MKFNLKIYFISFFILSSASIHSKDNGMNLPKSVLGWTRPDQPKEVNGKTIFDYMDGAGELYVGYRFDHLEAYTYQSSHSEEILVELYHMKSSDDAFGLLSLDWTGVPIELSDAAIPKTDAPIAPAKRFLYGAGLLRIWSDDVFARIMADRETPESKEAVMTLGRMIVSGRKNTEPPAFLNALPPSFTEGWRLEPGIGPIPVGFGHGEVQSVPHMCHPLYRCGQSVARADPFSQGLFS
jgi:hypothetical protein